eukprot:TRINITY_DN5525_c0_g1_i1.p1 TRINITY_DN5525_c0_g1~~TRINITY_DN5525_c0_g1_i1.p1  ORF type:complete len:185 (-),score=62.13 TRINITY_DN5525_c0_g1_i1:20-574(-)
MVTRGILKIIDQDYVQVCNDTEINEKRKQRGTEMYLFLCNLLWHFLDAYWLVSLCFLYLVPNKIITENSFINLVQNTGESLYFEGQMDLYEAISKDKLDNALILFENWKIIEFPQINGINQQIPEKFIRLTSEYQDNKKIEQLNLQIAKYRKASIAYKSRRFKGLQNTDTTDALDYVSKRISCI